MKKQKNKIRAKNPGKSKPAVKNPDKSVRDKLKSESKLKKFWRWGVTFAFLFLALNLIVSDYVLAQGYDSSEFMLPNAVLPQTTCSNDIEEVYVDGSIKLKENYYSRSILNQNPYNHNSTEQGFAYTHTETYWKLPLTTPSHADISEFRIRHRDVVSYGAAVHEWWSYTILTEKLDPSAPPSNPPILLRELCVVVYKFANSELINMGSVSVRLESDSLNYIYTIRQEGYLQEIMVGTTKTVQYVHNVSLYKNETLDSSAVFLGAWSPNTKIVQHTHTFTNERDIDFFSRYNQKYHFRSLIGDMNAIKKLGREKPSLKLIYNANSRVMQPIVFDNDADLEYWEYASFHLINSGSEKIAFSETINNNTIEYHTDFNYLSVDSNQKRYYYNDRTIDPDSWGDWVIVMFEYKVSFNWLRNMLVLLVNSIIFLTQIALYLLILAFNSLFVWLILQIVVVIWNYPIYWVYVGIVGVIFYVIVALSLLWEYVIAPIFNWIYESVILPIWEYLKQAWTWFMPNGMIFLIDLYLALVSYVLAAILFVLGLGRIEYEAIRLVILELLITLNHGIFDFVFVFIDNMLLFLAFGGTYITLFGMCYIMFIFVKARGYVNNAHRLESVMNVYKLPIVLMVRAFAYIVGFINGGVPTDGADE